VYDVGLIGVTTKESWIILTFGVGGTNLLDLKKIIAIRYAGFSLQVNVIIIGVVMIAKSMTLTSWNSWGRSGSIV